VTLGVANVSRGKSPIGATASLLTGVLEGASRLTSHKGAFMRRLVVLIALALGTRAAHANSDLFYLGAGVTEGTLTASNNGYFAFGQPDLTQASWKAFVGVRQLSWLAVDAERIDFGSGNSGSFSNETTDITHITSSAWAVYVVGFLPVPWRTVDVFA
jgi:hypothetical protein